MPEKTTSVCALCLMLSRRFTYDTDCDPTCSPPDLLPSPLKDAEGTRTPGFATTKQANGRRPWPAVQGRGLAANVTIAGVNRWRAGTCAHAYGGRAAEAPWRPASVLSFACKKGHCLSRTRPYPHSTSIIVNAVIIVRYACRKDWWGLPVHLVGLSLPRVSLTAYAQMRPEWHINAKIWLYEAVAPCKPLSSRCRTTVAGFARRRATRYGFNSCQIASVPGQTIT